MDNSVFVARCAAYEDAAHAVARALDAFGGAKKLLDGRRSVLVKPNLVAPLRPQTAATTHPAVVEALCRLFQECGARVSVIDSTAAPHSRATLGLLYRATGLETALAPLGDVLCHDTRVKKTAFPDGKLVHSFPLLAPAAEAELVVTAGKVKTHGFTRFSGATKNLFGCVAGMEKPAMHSRFPLPADFADMLVDLVQCIKPGFALLDGVVGMDGHGPTAGSPKALGAILAGPNPYAVDLAACHLISLRPGDVPHLAAAADRGLVERSPSRLTWLGDDPAGLVTQFQPAGAPKKNGRPISLVSLLPGRFVAWARKISAPWPLISGRCTGCAECARICPRKTIDMADRRAAIRYDACIQCYCCHEFCPARAIDFGRRP